MALTPGDRQPLSLKIKFLRARGERTTDDLLLKFAGQESPFSDTFRENAQLFLKIGVVRRTTDSFELDPSQIRYNALVGQDGVNIRLCVDASGTPPGQYRTLFQLAEPRLQHSPMVLEFTVQEHRLWLMFLVLGASSAAGALVLYIRDRSHGRQATVRQPSSRHLRQWVGRSYIALAVGTGMAVLAWRDQYLVNESWGDSGFQFFDLAVACMVAFTGLGTLGAIADERLPATAPSVWGPKPSTAASQADA